MSYLLGKVRVLSTIGAKTGLRIGGTTGGLKIGGVDLNVITDPAGKPYIPGSSLKGKLRTLQERKEQVAWNRLDRRGNPTGHQCKDDESFKDCPICRIWGILGGAAFTLPTLTRLFVRDTFLDENSITEEMRKNLDLQWTEVKFETAIDRVKGTALEGSLRQTERVPAGAKFRDCEMIFNVYEEPDKDLLKKIFEAMELLEHDYLGGMGSRGYGQVAFNDIEIFWNKREDYETGSLDQERINNGFNTPVTIVKNFGMVREKLS